LDNRIREFRQKLGISQVELARRAHTAGPNLSAVERGERKAWPKLKRSLARVLKTSQTDLFGTGVEFRDEKNEHVVILPEFVEMTENSSGRSLVQCDHTKAICRRNRNGWNQHKC
jgi:putative transcriptional regulator